MARSPFPVTTTPVDITAGLPTGVAYVVQHVGGSPVSYVTSASADDDVGWFVVTLYEHFLIPADVSHPVWVRTSLGTARLSIGDM